MMVRRSNDSATVRAFAAGLVAATLLVAACGTSPLTTGAGTPSPAPSGGGATRTLTVFAAASLKDAFAALARAYTAEHPATTFVFSFDASSALRAQIEQGAPVDVFASADTKNAAALATAGLTVGPPTAFAANRLTLIVPTGDPAGIRSPADLARAGIRVIAAGPEVPITKYADQAIANLATQPGYPAGYAARVAANIVSREDNVRAVVAKVELGEGDAAIVYVTDAKASTKVVALPIPDAANVTARYAAVALKAAPDSADAAAFVAWLAGPEASAILGGFGFAPPR